MASDNYYVMDIKSNDCFLCVKWQAHGQNADLMTEFMDEIGAAYTLLDGWIVAAERAESLLEMAEHLGFMVKVS